MITETPEYKQALKEFLKIKDRPVCIFVLNNESLPLKKRIQVRDYNPKLDIEDGRVLIVCFNEKIMVENISFCDVCGCNPCDCHWGDY
tara:strand:+ start:393 stop:656 length:264 start_codon:yes stop_codon:yes gene_type:complete